MPVVFTGYNHSNYFYPNEGETIFTSNGNFIVPNGISSISIVAVGGGGAGAGIAASTERSGPGGGGALSYVNDVSVTPGEILTVVVGQRGLANNNAGKPGGNSYVQRGNTDLVHAGGGMGGFWVVNNTITIGTANGGTVVVGTGGAGGRGPGAQGGGGGAGGYAGSGGNGRSGSGTGGAPATGSGGGAGGGRPGLTDGGDGGGGVGIYGLGADGVPSDGTTPSTGGSGGGSSQGIGTNDFGGYGGDYGGGGGTVEEATAPQVGGNGGNGVVRIIWSDSRLRQFPNTNVDGTTVTQPQFITPLALPYITAVESLSNQTTYTFNGVSVGSSVSGANNRYIVIVASVSGVGAGTISNLTVDGNNATLVSESSATVAEGSESHHRVYSIQDNTKTTANVVVTNTSGKGRCYISVYNLVNPTNTSPSIVANTPLYTTSISTLSNILNVSANDVILAYASSDNRTFTWTGVTENNESTSEAGSPVVSHANTRIVTASSAYTVGVTYSTAGTNAKLFTLRWC